MSKLQVNIANHTLQEQVHLVKEYKEKKGVQKNRGSFLHITHLEL